MALVYFQRIVTPETLIEQASVLLCVVACATQNFCVQSSKQYGAGTKTNIDQRNR